MVEALGGRIEAGDEAVAGEPAAIVGRIAIIEAIGQQEIEQLVLRQAIAIGLGRDGRCDQHHGGQQAKAMRPHSTASGTRAAHWRAMKSS